VSRRRALVRAVAALLAAGTLSGCVGLATSSPVQPGQAVAGGQAPPVRVLFPGPGPNASQEQIIRGFLRATAASDGSYDVARSFLTPDAAKRWTPEGDIEIFSTEPSLAIRVVDEGTSVLTGTIDATITAEGRYRTLAPGSTKSVTVKFARIEGQWRIADLPPDFGRWLRSSDIPRLLQPYAVHYVARDRRLLIPDVRWFPLDHLATRLARAQLDGVPAYLAGAARTDIPAGARLTADSVSVTGGVATVDLTAAAPTQQAVRENLLAQLVSTLMQDPSVRGITVRVAGTSLDLPDVPSPITSPADVGFPVTTVPTLPGPFVRRGAAIAAFDPSGSGREPKIVSPYPPVPTNFTSLALSADGQEIAGVDPDERGISRWRGQTQYQVPFFGTDVGAPAYDQAGWLWVGGVGVEENAGIRLWVVNSAAAPNDPEASTARPVRADWLAGRRVVEAKVAADSERIAVLSLGAKGLGARIDIAGIVRDSTGAPISLAQPLRVGDAIASMSGLTWLDGVTVATLGRVGTKEALRPYVVPLAGDYHALSVAPQATSIASLGGERSIFVVTAKGEVLARAGQQWISRGPATDLLVAGG
jgi:hypothetical protein